MMNVEPDPALICAACGRWKPCRHCPPPATTVYDADGDRWEIDDLNGFWFSPTSKLCFATLWELDDAFGPLYTVVGDRL